MPIVDYRMLEQINKCDGMKSWMTPNIEEDEHESRNRATLEDMAIEPVVENPKEITGRQKPIMGTIPPVAEALQCAVHEHGHGRHGEWNWRETPINLTTYIKAVARHLAAVLDGEWLDPDSKLPHFSHIACGTNIAIDALSVGNLINDLPPPGMGANLVAAIEAVKTLPPRVER